MSRLRNLVATVRIISRRRAAILWAGAAILFVSWPGSTAALATVYDLTSTSGLSVSGTITTNPQQGITGIAAVMPAVPEPSIWATMLLGIGVVGWRLRRTAASGTTPLPA